MDLLRILGDSFRDVFAAIPAPIAPQAQVDEALCEACESCANPAADVPAEACGVCR